MEGSSPTLARAGVARADLVPGLGLHGRQPPRADRPRLLQSATRLRAARGDEHRQPPGRPAAPRPSRVTERARPSPRPRTRTPRDGPRDGRRPVLPEPAGLRHRRPLRVLRPGRAAPRAPRATSSRRRSSATPALGRRARRGPARPVIYGHGLLGDARSRLTSGPSRPRNRGNLVFCGTAWIGMSARRPRHRRAELGDLSSFPALADRLQQGFVNFLFLGRLMIHPRGLGRTRPSRGGASSVLDRSGSTSTATARAASSAAR